MQCNELIRRFRGLPEDEGFIPFWFWNDDLQDDHLIYQIHEMHEKGVDQFLIHARFGLQVKYLSDEWFNKIDLALREAEKLGMRVWIYDEENWPSGYAGERVLAENPDYCGKCLFRVPKGCDDLRDDWRFVDSRNGWDYYRGYCHWNISYTNSYYTDMLSAEATDCFIRVTHAEYVRRFSSHIGKTLMGFFVDEPGFYNNITIYNARDDENTIVWSDDLPERFQAMKGYDLMDVIGLMWHNDDSRALKVKTDFYDVVCALYCERFLGRLREYCHANNLLLIGHLHMEEFLPYHVKTQGDLMRCLNELDWSGVDRIDLNWEKLSEKYASSAQLIYDKPRTLSETFCFSGWDNHLAKMKYWIDWQMTKGVDTICLHAFYSSIEGERRWECPPSLFFQNDYWQYFRRLSDYGRRMSFLIRQGEPVLDLGVYYPIATQVDLLWPNSQVQADQHDRAFIEMATSLTRHQYDYLIVNDDGLKAAQIKDGVMYLKSAKLRSIVLFGLTCMHADVANKLIAFAEQGGQLILLDCQHLRTVEGTGEAEQLLRAPNIVCINGYQHCKNYTLTFDAKKIIPALARAGVQPLVIAPENKRIDSCRRAYENGDMIFALNGEDTSTKIRVPLAEGEHAYIMDAHSGELSELPRACPGDQWVEVMLLEQQGIPVLRTKAVLPCKTISAMPAKVTRMALDDGWHIVLDGETYNSSLRSWADLGKPYFSGRAEYTRIIHWAKDSGSKVVLELGRVCHTADVYINGVLAGSCVWAPWSVDVTPFLREGENQIKISVANTLGNEFERKPFPSGLLGGVALCAFAD